MIKMILCDMDGTLLKDDKTFADDLEKVIDYCDTHGVIFGIASGRNYASLLLTFEEYAHRMLFISDNGGCATYKGKNLFNTTMDKEDVRHMVEDVHKMNDAHVCISALDGGYIDSTNERFINTCNIVFKPYKIIQSIDEIHSDISKLTFCDYMLAEEQSYPHYRDHYGDRYEVTLSGDIWMDIVPKGISKGIGLNKVAKLLNVSIEDTIAFGDHMNDVELLKAAGCGYAMKNSYPDVFQYANAVTEYTNNESGVTKTIFKLIEEGKM